MTTTITEQSLVERHSSIADDLDKGVEAFSMSVHGHLHHLSNDNTRIILRNGIRAAYLAMAPNAS